MFVVMPYLHVCPSRSRLCHTLCPLWACAYRSLGPLTYMVASITLVVCLDVTACETHLRDIGVLVTHCSVLHAMSICLPCLLCATHLAFFASLHFCTLAYKCMHESVCRPYSNPMEFWSRNHIYSVLSRMDLDLTTKVCVRS